MKDKDGKQIEPPTTSIILDNNLDTLQSQVKNKVRKIKVNGEALSVPDEPEIFLKPTHRAGHKEFIQLTDDNFHDEIRRSWQHFRAVLDKRGSKTEAVVLDIFTYVDTPVPNSTTLHRGSQTTVRAHAESISRAVRQGRLPQMGRYESAFAAQTLSRRKAAVPQDGTAPVIGETVTRAQIRHIDRMVEEGRIPATPPAELDGPITLQVTSITFASRDELRRAVGLTSGFHINGLHDNQPRSPSRLSENIDDIDDRS
ncbi:hypothetical protein DFQ27_000277, partial [Actinomortierella ambigua]